MREVVKADYPFVREEVDRAEAKRRFKDDPLKLERIEDLGPDEVISVYTDGPRSEEHTSELQSRLHLVCRLLLEKKKKKPLTIGMILRPSANQSSEQFT